MDLYDEIEAKKKSEVQFKESLIQEVMKINADSKLRFSTDGLQAMNEVIRSFTLEAVWRSGNQASNEGLTTVTIEHLEKILPQLMLDFA